MSASSGLVTSAGSEQWPRRAQCSAVGGAPEAAALRRSRALERVAPIAWILRATERLARSLARQHGVPWLAEDLAQLGLETACRLAPTYETSRGAFTTFLHPYARGAMLNAIGRERSYRARIVANAELERRHVEAASELCDVEPVDEAPTAEDVLVAVGDTHARAAALDRTLQALRPAERRLAHECLVSRRPLSEVCEEVGFGVRTARRRLAKIVERLRRAAGDEHRR